MEDAPKFIIFIEIDTCKFFLLLFWLALKKPDHYMLRILVVLICSGWRCVTSVAPSSRAFSFIHSFRPVRSCAFASASTLILTHTEIGYTDDDAFTDIFVSYHLVFVAVFRNHYAFRPTTIDKTIHSRHLCLEYRHTDIRSVHGLFRLQCGYVNIFRICTTILEL